MSLTELRVVAPETTDILEGIEKISLACIDKGVQLSDFTDNIGEIFKMIEGAQKAPDEVTALKREGVKHMAIWSYDLAFKIMDAIEANKTP